MCYLHMFLGLRMRKSLRMRMFLRFFLRRHFSNYWCIQYLNRKASTAGLHVQKMKTAREGRADADHVEVSFGNSR